MKNSRWEKLIQSGFRLPFYMNLYVEGQILSVHKVSGWHMPLSFLVIEQQLNTVYYSPEAMKEYQVYITPKLKTKRFREHFLSSFIKSDSKLLSVCRKISYTDYEHASFELLEKHLKEFVSAFRYKFGMYALPKFTDLAMRDLLSELLSSDLSDDELFILTKPDTLSEYTEERINFLSIVEKIKSLNLESLFKKTVTDIFDTLGRSHPSLYYSIEAHVAKYEWIPVTSHHIQPMTLESMITSLGRGLSDNDSFKELQERKEEETKAGQDRKKLFGDRRLTRADKDVLSFIQGLNEINESRKASLSKALLWSYPLFRALADKFNVDSISLRQLTSGEIFDALQKKKLTVEHHKNIQERFKCYACLLREGKVITASGEKAVFLAKHELGVANYANITEVHGRVAVKGLVQGRVRLVLREHQVGQLLAGEILVTSMTDPDMITAMKRAAAIVTDEGGVTCHAAITSRELGVPCVIGTKISTQVFKNGDLVEVDAGKGVVRRVKEN